MDNLTQSPQSQKAEIRILADFDDILQVILIVQNVQKNLKTLKTCFS